ncbi:TIGR01459 family HAD-type hydrolase [Paracoccaceae bacterium]|jgi:HAD superfamily hydrolase (TIGR01459 family)|nr:TIGR01459 family HAD-type hydrolase [Paracoccaceae bacterium]NDI12834.1 TIGR01459 family HAD-type hydrolase [Paracoccaceae bacterium]
MTQIVNALSDISAQYDALFVDLWGCVHNGVRAFDAANKALIEYRAGGGIVVLVTNSPRPRAQVEQQLADFGVARDAWDSIASSGDSARSALFLGAVGQKIYFIGTDAELPFFEPLKLIDDPIQTEHVPIEEAEGIVCTGLPTADGTPDDVRAPLLYAKQKGLKLLCANPDIIVDRGDKREWCAGAVAQAYTEMGGTSLYFGKPHAPIYDLARRRLSAIRPNIPDDRILAIGDGITTDIQGAIGEGIDSLFITGGLAAKETATVTQPDPEKLSQYVLEKQLDPTFSIGFLR